jgi:subtilisin-like proprotein convertase family protein
VPPAPPLLSVSESSIATSEAGLAASFEVVLLRPPTAPVEVEVHSGDPGEGLVAAPGYAAPAAARSVTFTPDDWDEPRTITIHGVSDQIDDGDAAYQVTVRVTFSEDPEYAGARPSAAVRVTNLDEDVPGLWLSAPRLAVLERGPAESFHVRLTSRPTAPVNVEVTSLDVSEGLLATGPAGCGYASSAFWVSFDATSWASPQQVTLCPADDPFVDGDQTFSIRLRVVSAPTSEYASLPDREVAVTNADDESGYSIMGAATPLLTSEDGKSATFTVVLNAAPLADVVLPVASGDPGEGLVASADAGPAASIALTFTPSTWSVPQTVTVVGQDDAAAPVQLDDVGYSVVVGPSTSADPAFAGLDTRAVSVLNRDDDVPFAVVVSSAAQPLLTDESGTTAAFSVSLSRPPISSLQVPVVSSDPTEGLVASGGPADASLGLAFSHDDWNIPRTVTVTGVRDWVADGDVTYGITVGPTTGDPEFEVLPTQSVLVTNAHVDVLPPAWQASLDVPKPVTDGATASSTLSASGPAVLFSVKVRVDIEHTWTSDLILTITSPDGTTVTLAERAGGSGANFTGTVFDDDATTAIASGAAPFSGSYRPTQPLSALAGRSGNGTWTLRVRDAAARDVGTLSGWALWLE